MRVMHRSGLSSPTNTRWIAYLRDLALRLTSTQPRPERVVSIAKIGVHQPVAALEFDGSGKRGLPRTVRARDYRECGHTALGGVRRQFADDFVVLSGRGARQPADLESSAIGAFHDIETIAVYIEDGKPVCKRLGKCFAGRCPHCIVELSATEIVGHSHN
jgi:hypothetical protein